MCLCSPTWPSPSHRFNTSVIFLCSFDQHWSSKRSIQNHLCMWLKVITKNLHLYLDFKHMARTFSQQRFKYLPCYTQWFINILYNCSYDCLCFSILGWQKGMRQKFNLHILPTSQTLVRLRLKPFTFPMRAMEII